MRTIVVPVNFSPCSWNAARYAAGLAMATRAGIHLLHVIQIPLPATEMVMNEYLYEQMQESGEDGLKAIKEDIRQRTAGQVKVETHLEAGSVAVKLEELFTKLNADLTVMGVTGPTMEKFLAGSTAGPLLHLRHPMLVIPDSAEYKPIRLITLACDKGDLHRGIPHSLPFLAELKARFGAAIHIVTVETSEAISDEAICYPEEGPGSLAGLNPSRHYLRRPSIEDGLEEYLRDHSADLAVVFPKRHSLLEFHQSRSRRLARHAATPVLCLPE